MRVLKYDFIIYITVIWGLVACTTGQVKTTKSLDLSKTALIELQVESANNRLQTEAITQQAGKNLEDWHYPIETLSGQAYSHILKAVIGNIEHGKTPTGFSFSAGNSDPRALNFQKADILSITCQLSSVTQPDQIAELNMGFSDSAVTTSTPNLNELANHVSTVCFNLLHELNWPVDKNNIKPEQPSKTINWIPEIRIETQQDMPVKSQNTGSTDNPELIKEEQVESPKQVTKEINKAGRKIYIIHNQGNPITFQLGHERK